jgi:anti-sigma B factor antagonist
VSTKPPELSIQHDVIDDRLIVMVSGDLDLGSAPALESAVSELAPLDHPLVIDLGGVGFIDSSGLRSLLAINQVVVDAGGAPVTLAGGTPATKRLIELTGIDRVFTIEG